MSKMILVDEKTVKQALEALESLRHSWAEARFISISALRQALETHPAAFDYNQLEDALNSLAFYRRRCELLQQWQSNMRDPERTIVCDILANGQTLPLGVAGDRYKQQPADELDRNACEELNHAEEVLDALSVDLNMEQTDFDCIGDYINAVFEAQAKKLTNAPAIPEGMKLVPVEPTQEMLRAATNYGARTKVTCGRDYFKAMLAAAPEQSSEPPVGPSSSNGLSI